jgi:predicted dehydrogenase
VQAFVNFANRFVHADMATRYVIQNGLIGKPIYADMNLDDNISVPTMLWGDRSKEWASTSSTAHFLMSHTVDLVRWYLEPAEVEKVYAISQNQRLGYTPDLYDAFLFMSDGIRVRLRSEWIRHMDILVEFRQYVGGADGGVFHNKHGGFNAANGWKANLDSDVSMDRLRSIQRKLEEYGVKVTASLEPDQSRRGEGWRPSLQLGAEGTENRIGWSYFMDAIEEGNQSPESWREFGRLPTIEDGYEAVKVVSAIVKSAETGRAVKISR